MGKPFEIIAAPFTAYWAPLGEDFPDIDETPGGAWTLIGASGSRNYSDEGVTVAHDQTIEQFRGAGATGPMKVQRTEENLAVRFTLWDLTLEQYRLALNQNAPATTAAGTGTPGFKAVQLYRGVDVQLLALLLRGKFSPEGEGWATQYEIPACYQSGSPEPVFAKGAPAGLALEFTAIEDPDAAEDEERFGRLVVQHQDPLD